MSGIINGISSVSYFTDSVEALDKKSETIPNQIETIVEDVYSNRTSSISDAKTSKAFMEFSSMIQKEVENVNLELSDGLVDMANGIRDTIKEITDRVTDEDIKAIVDSHYNPEKVSIGIFRNILENNKTAVKLDDYDKLDEEVEKSVAEFDKTFDSTEDLKTIIHTLVKNNLPVNSNNISKVQSCLTKFDTIKGLSVDEMVNNLSVGGSLSLDNVYKNKFAAINESGDLSELDQLENQIVKLVESYDMDITEESVELAKKMVSNEIEFNPENMNKAKAMLGGFDGIDREYIVSKAAENMKENRATSKIDLDINGENGLKDGALNQALGKEINEKMDALSRVKLGDIQQVIDSEDTVNIENVIDASEENSVGIQNVAIDQKGYSIEAVRAKINIEEIRLMMTADAANKMNLKEFDINTAPIEEVVNALRGLEQASLEQQLEVNELSASSSEAIKAKAIFDQLSYIRIAPFTGISKVASNEIGFNIGELGAEAVNEIKGATSEKLGIQLGAYNSPSVNQQSDEMNLQLIKLFGMEGVEGNSTIDYESLNALKLEGGDSIITLSQKAMNRYEIMETKPRSDMGDSIQKAFTQIDSILEELNLENSEANQRAVKILAYNSMEITPEQIEYIKNIDLKVSKVANQLHPTVVIDMMKENLSPMDMEIDEVLSYMEDFERENGETNYEKIAKIIYDMESSDSLSEKEREGLVGVYRVLSTISRSMGRASGFLVNHNMEVNVNNLFEAAKYIKQTNGTGGLINADVDDEFGLIDSSNEIDKSIKQTINEALEESRIQNKGLEIETFIGKKIEEDKAVIGLEDVGFEELRTDVERISSLDTEDITLLQRNNIKANIQNLRSFMDIKDSSFILSNELKSSLKNIIDSDISSEYIGELEETIALLSNGEGDYSEKIDDLRAILEEIEAEVLSTEDNSKEINEAVSKAQDVLEIQKPFIDEDYYQIPIMINGNITQLNMYYVNDQSNNIEETDELKVYLYFKTNNLGKVQGYMNIKDNNMSFQMYSDKREGLDALKDFSSEIEQVFKDSTYNLTGVSYEYFNGESPIGEEIKVDTQSPDSNNHEGSFEISI